MSLSQSIHTVEDSEAVGRGTQLSTTFTEAILDLGHFAEACLVVWVVALVRGSWL